MNILILGGTQFSGLHLVRAAVAAGHVVTVVHRGRHGGNVPAGVAEVVGDRDPAVGDGLERLGGLIAGGARWDAAVDMSGYVPRVVGAAADLLGPVVGRYVFVSTVAVYPGGAEGAPDEGSPMVELADPSVEEITAATYGGLKVLCERVLLEKVGDRAVVVRPGFIVGPGDPTDRFTYWVRRLAAGGPVLVPSEVDFPSRWIDGRDLAEFMLRCVEPGLEGVFNCLGPREPVGFGAFLEAIARGVGGVGGSEKVEWVGRDAAWREAHGVRDGAELPLFMGMGRASLGRTRADRAFEAGMRIRPLEETARDTLAWDRERGSPELAAGMTEEREAELLRAPVG
jgi:2'-hydroxyisoflavone reductase